LPKLAKNAKEEKGTRYIEDFLAARPELLDQILRLFGLSTAKKMRRRKNTSQAEFSTLEGAFLPENFWSGGLAKFDRALRGIPKPHQNIAICAEPAAKETIGRDTIKTLGIESKGKARYQRETSDAYGFRGKSSGGEQRGRVTRILEAPASVKTVNGF
jgi:hypothetical protein